MKAGSPMTMNSVSTQMDVNELYDIIESLEIQLKHLKNDLKITQEEYDNSVRKYFEIYTNLEKIIEERTQDLVKTQHVLEQKGRELQIMLDATPALIYYKDPDHRYLRVNKAFAETLGLPINEILGHSHRELFPSAAQSDTEPDHQVIETGNPVLGSLEMLPVRSGTRQIQLDRIPYRNSDDQVIGIIGFALDVTELKKAEKEKKALEDQLTQAQKMESIGVLAGGVAHDFNNVLGVILGYSQLAFNELDEDMRAKHYLSEVIKSTQSATDIVRPLLDYAKPQKYEFQPVDIYERTAFVVKQLRKSIVFDDKRMSVQMTGETKVVAKVDPVKIEQVLLNIGKNALQALPVNRSGTVEFSVNRVTLDAAECKTKLGLTPDEYITITISDNGTGIAEENLQKIFDPFFTTKQIGEGTGLGLSQAYSIIKKHQGFIGVDSEIDHGTTFTIYLHSYNGKISDDSDTTPETDSVILEEGRILVVEDTDPLREMVKTVMEKYGYSVELAANGKEGVEKFEAFQPDIVIMDVKMPVMDGVEAFKAIRERDPEAKIVFSTGYGITYNDIADLGANGYISKPFEPVSLVKKIHETIHT